MNRWGTWGLDGTYNICTRYEYAVNRFSYHLVGHITTSTTTEYLYNNTRQQTKDNPSLFHEVVHTLKKCVENVRTTSIQYCSTCRKFEYLMQIFLIKFSAEAPTVRVWAAAHNIVILSLSSSHRYLGYIYTIIGYIYVQAVPWSGRGRTLVPGRTLVWHFGLRFGSGQSTAVQVKYSSGTTQQQYMYL